LPNFEAFMSVDLPGNMAELRRAIDALRDQFDIA
jgi:hypothetical protein